MTIDGRETVWYVWMRKDSRTGDVQLMKVAEQPLAVRLARADKANAVTVYMFGDVFGWYVWSADAGAYLFVKVGAMATLAAIEGRVVI